MATTKKNHFYYVLVFTNSGVRYVTSVLYYPDKVAYWNVKEKPYEFGRQDEAEYMAMALTLNGNSAVAVTSTYEIESHPYNYRDYHIEWSKNEYPYNIKPNGEED